ncbi:MULTISPECIES: acetylxylan esterase [unclassified Spirosoma]|uniref:glucuronyl esterase domain-containing protein n=1 Tax=unclassified Spirosoma TaxID=2621999 RepID=UPI0009663BC3|nr:MULTISPECIES: acetylxylan esterase [unclassified Spirosoma]MBN8823391.1 acetylxylan esterase [Spirosoma sp.]OJW71991.1 MAG: acetylxylan esterase [Spirosoma sp. 48-14]
MPKHLALVLLTSLPCWALAQQAAIDSSKYPPLKTMTAQQDQANMMQQLGIRKLRPGPSGNESDPNHANYDESQANPCPQLPDVLTTKKGRKVTTPEQWWSIRRPEIIEDFEKEMYGRIPANVPKVTWTTKITDNEFVGRIPVLARHMIGRVDNSEYPLISVNINMVLVLPQNVKGPVPVMIMLGFPTLPAPAQPSLPELEKINAAFKDMMIKSNPELKAIFDKYPAYSPITRLPGPNFFAPAPNGDSPPTEQLLAAGWGYCTLEPGSIQADNGAGLTRGIIGLTNKGQPRKPEDWGALRAWGWGASRVLDYLETDPLVNAKQVAIEGVSRYGKAALVAMAFDQRFAMVLIGSSGKGGTTLQRRVFGEAVESLAGSGEYHWMAGNYLNYAASESSSGPKTGCDLPIDSHELLALCAPRPTFVSYGIPEKGDAKWLDQMGSYKATVAAGPVFQLLGAKDLSANSEYNKDIMPPVLTGLMNGELAWRQHNGGHTDAPNFQYFIPWANKLLRYERVAK